MCGFENYIDNDENVVLKIYNKNKAFVLQKAIEV